MRISPWDGIKLHHKLISLTDCINVYETSSYRNLGIVNRRITSSISTHNPAHSGIGSGTGTSPTVDFTTGSHKPK